MATSKSPPSLWDQVRARLDGDLLADLGLQLPSRFPTDLVEHEIEVLLEDGPSFAFVAWKASPRRPVFFLTDDGSCDVVAATRDELAALLLYAGADPHHRSGAKTARASLSREVRGRLDSVRDDLGLSADPALYATLRKRAKDLLGDVNLYAPATPRVIPDGPRLFAPDRGTKPAAKGASVAEKVTTRSTQPSLSIDRVADDPAQTRFSSSSAPRSAFKKVVWRTSATPFTGSGGYNLGATVKGGSAYAWGGNWVASFDLASGALRWKRRLPEKPRVSDRGEVCTAGGSVFVFQGNAVYALDEGNGKTRYRAPHRRDITAFPLVAGSVFVADLTYGVSAFDAATGKKLWEQRDGGGSTGELSAAADRVFVCGRDGFVRALDAATGKVVWRGKEANASYLSSTAVVGPWVIAGALSGGGLVVFDASTGKAASRIKHEVGQVDGPFAIAGSKVVYHAGAKAWCVDVETRKVVWSCRLGFGPTGVVNRDGYLAVTEADGLVFVDLESGKTLWTLRDVVGSTLEWRVVPHLYDGGALVVITKDGKRDLALLR